MQAIAGVFASSNDARNTAQKLRDLGISENHLALLLPGRHKNVAVAVTAAEQPGMGKVLGGTVGAAAGAATGVELGAVLGAAIPGVGPVMVGGLLGAAIIGLAAGAGVGATVGGKVEAMLSEGLPEDELYVYEDALRRGRSVVIALAEDEQRSASVRSLMKQQGAETIDAAREKWWIGLRDVEHEHYTTAGGDFRQDELFYRLGFQAALHARTRGKEYDQVLSEMAEDVEELKRQYPGKYVEGPFRRGYERGRAHFESFRSKN